VVLESIESIFALEMVLELLESLEQLKFAGELIAFVQRRFLEGEILEKKVVVSRADVKDSWAK
jgi:hypothetical protein